MQGKQNERQRLIGEHCSNCLIGSTLLALGRKLNNLDNKEQHWTEGELFYLINHLDVLGIERGLMQVARRLEREPLHVEIQYYSIKEKSTRNMAV